ncbi:hypothetical protein BYT27DRAFT_7336620 [Phlegmacium glaucopus]|nr:hypothetical protein BYT27DRAFT_7336620 [Phlegmacium glaucopus]
MADAGDEGVYVKKTSQQLTCSLPGPSLHRLGFIVQQLRHRLVIISTIELDFIHRIHHKETTRVFVLQSESTDNGYGAAVEVIAGERPVARSTPTERSLNTNRHNWAYRNLRSTCDHLRTGNSQVNRNPAGCSGGHNAISPFRPSGEIPSSPAGTWVGTRIAAQILSGWLLGWTPELQQNHTLWTIGLGLPFGWAPELQENRTLWTIGLGLLQFGCPPELQQNRTIWTMLAAWVGTRIAAKWHPLDNQVGLAAIRVGTRIAAKSLPFLR